MQGVNLNHVAFGDALLLYDEINDLPSNSLNSERCVIYGTCNAGEGRENAANMVNITHEKGAMTVIGWTGLTHVHQMNTWLENFLIASGNGATITEARDFALRAVADKHGETNLGGLDDIYISGSTTQKLVS